MKNSKKKYIIIMPVCILLIGIAVAVGVHFLKDSAYSRDLSEITRVTPSWTEEMVILYEKDFFGNGRYEQEESEEFVTLKFEPIGKGDGNVFWAHMYTFEKSTGKLYKFVYWSWGADSRCSHTLQLYRSILEQYGHEEYRYDHLESYNGMLGGEKYHVGVQVVDAYLGITGDTRIWIEFYPGWVD